MFAVVGFSEALISSFGQNSGGLTKNGAGDVDVKYYDIIKGLFIWEAGRLPGREVCLGGTFTGTGRLQRRDVRRGGTFTEAGRLPGQDVKRDLAAYVFNK